MKNEARILGGFSSGENGFLNFVPYRAARARFAAEIVCREVGARAPR
jgi:hypothetical protein